MILSRQKCGLMIIDVQDKVFRTVENPCEVMYNMQKAIKGALLLGLPIVVTEQYPQGLGSTIGAIKALLGEKQVYLPKTTFSCLGDAAIKDQILAMPIDQWILVGIEAHVCILQTAMELIEAKKQVVVLNDCISSRSIYDFSTAIAEMRDIGVRVSSTETVLFELIKDSKAAEFKQLSQLIKNDTIPC